MPRAPDDFAAFHHRTFSHVWRVLGRAGIRREAERCEVAQEVYIVAHAKRAKRNQKVPEVAWIGCIARRIGWRYRALARTQRELLAPERASEPPAASPSPEEAALGRDQYLSVMESLDEDRREVFEMHHVDGFTIAEIAAALEKPDGTVSTLLRRAQEDIDTAASRLRAREARACRAWMLPLATFDWREIGLLFDGPPSEIEKLALRGACRGLARAVAEGAVAAGSSTAIKGALFGSGLVVGGGAVGAAFAVHLATVPAPPPISAAPETSPVALAVTVTTTASAAAETQAAPPAARTSARAASAASPPPTVAVAGIDPEEQRLLSRAESAIAAGKLDNAKAALAEYDRRFPLGALRAERALTGAKLTSAHPPSALDGGRAPNRIMGTDED